MGSPKLFISAADIFADYREGGFGRYHGRYWIPATVRSTGGRQTAREIEIKVPVFTPEGVAGAPEKP
jgi:hypothetical protein